MPYPSKLTPDLILNSAQTLLDAGGAAALNMRPLAAALGVQASSLYRHFPDREALLQALEDAASTEFGRVLQGASSGKPPREALWAAAEAYLSHARRFPHRYGLLLSPRLPATAQPGPGKDLWNTVLNLVSALSRIPDDTARTVALWAFLHGYAVLDRSGLFGLSGPRGSFDIGVNALLDEMERAAPAASA
ncbi:TetR/AcrR family transcriptional regulator [Deinococcus rubellus]|uniref:TetR/AcrR family transcriptional regulator n=1 Tax=Deinococcus rubellus TaxID=1889240 RepID=A0ABY5YDH4_9DEIO|nr:TetR/AcrR family transcriptional regulator [Deinococcus rubellus]UWX62863.1 TetR/AcrR family transcriptional regulator [Deinococcus rubellus]